MAAANPAPSTDATLGMAGWNRLTERERLPWLLRAGSDVPADAWSVCKAGLPQHTLSPIAAQPRNNAAGRLITTSNRI